MYIGIKFDHKIGVEPIIEVLTSVARWLRLRVENSMRVDILNSVLSWSV